MTKQTARRKSQGAQRSPRKGPTTAPPRRTASMVCRGFCSWAVCTVHAAPLCGVRPNHMCAACMPLRVRGAGRAKGIVRDCRAGCGVWWLLCVYRLNHRRTGGNRCNGPFGACPDRKQNRELPAGTQPPLPTQHRGESCYTAPYGAHICSLDAGGFRYRPSHVLLGITIVRIALRLLCVASCPPSHVLLRDRGR